MADDQNFQELREKFEKLVLRRKVSPYLSQATRSKIIEKFASKTLPELTEIVEKELQSRAS